MKTPVPMIVLRTSAAKLQRPIERRSSGEARRLVSTYAECIGDAIDIVEPAGDKRDLQDAAIVEADFSQTLVVLRADARRVAGKLHDVVEHNTIAFIDRRVAVVVL